MMNVETKGPTFIGQIHMTVSFGRIKFYKKIPVQVILRSSLILAKAGAFMTLSNTDLVVVDPFL